jgi:TonB family protein
MLLAAAATAVAWYSARAGATDREKTPATQRAPSPAPATATIVAAPTPAAQRDTATTVPADDSAAREAAFEQEVNRRLREEMVKLQRQFDEEQRRQQAARLPLLQRPEPAPQSAAAGADPASSDTATEGPERQLASEGQLFDLSDVDQAPTVLRSPAPAYPQAAARQQLESSVIVTALISETGRVLDARVLRGDGSDAGFDEAAVAAVRTWEFTPGIKDGQRIRTWVPVNVDFRAPR